MRVQLTIRRAILLVIVSGLWASGSGLVHADDLAKVTTDVMLYTDTDSVQVFSPQLSAHRDLDEDGGKATARVTVDAVSAASVDVISNATARFAEVRTALDLSVAKAFGAYLPRLSYRLSHEPDYVSHGLGVGGQRRFAGGDTVLSASYGLQLDSIGRVDTPSDAFSESLTSHVAEIAATQVIDTRTVVRLVYGLTIQNGYMEKPYRSVPIFDQAGIAAAQADGVALDLDTFDRYRLAVRPPEEVPDTRYRHAIGVRAMRHVESLSSAVRLDYRFYGDSWGVYGHTLEPAITRTFGDSWRVNLFSRLHVQSSASFWRREYVVANPVAIPSLRTMDRALSSSWHLTGAARMEWDHEPISLYFELGSMYSSFTDHLLIDSRLAILSQAGLRWNL